MNYNINKFSDKGPRVDNQDRIQVSLINDKYLVACIADGVGGHPFGDVAAQKAIDYFLDLIHTSIDRNISNILLQTHYRLRQLISNRPELEGMATTFTGCVIADNKVWFCHTGDTRLYLLNDRTIEQLTTDHTELQRLINEKRISLEDAEYYPRKNIIESVLGTRKDPIIQGGELNVNYKDVVLLTSDGVHDLINSNLIFNSYVKSLDNSAFVKSLFDTVKINGAKDNFSAISIQLDF